ncbi:MAG TPA: phosphotransferase family protein [Solirubrobacteraceae bacterium]|jgi:aminoglycoside phosphotransferase (APT) family kinase protein|nr:phosphotransferase family protein [Solirubrobacteraceae bacterium]
MSAAIAPDDIVESHADVAPDARPPLLVLEPLRAFLDEHGLGTGRIRAEPIGEGHSNVTYLIERDSNPTHPQLVLRRPPRPPLPPSAHDVLREARLLTALAPTPARVPAVLAVCEDESLIGCPFYIMERVGGEVIVTQTPAPLDTPEQRRRIGQQLIDALVEIHAVDWQKVGLDGFGKPTGYLERQLRRFGGLWELNKTREIPAVERVGAWLAEHMPNQDPPTPATIVHGDYRLGNTMFAAGAPAELVAVFDWEMATIGDPLADVGYLCMFWTEASDPEGGLREHLGRVTRAEGYPTRAELIARYEERSGRSMGDLRWYTTLALWKSVVFMEGNYKRAVAGTTDDPYLKQFGEGVLELARQAEEVAHSG